MTLGLRGMKAKLLKLGDAYGASLVVYGAVAVLSALAEWSTFATAATVMPPLLAACAGFFVATGVNAVLSRRFAFKSRLHWFSELMLVMVSSAAVFVWNLAVFYILYQYLAVPLMIAKVVGTAAGFVINYCARQFWIFSRSPRYQVTSRYFTGSLWTGADDTDDGIFGDSNSRSDA